MFGRAEWLICCRAGPGGDTFCDRSTGSFDKPGIIKVLETGGKEF